MKWNSKFLHFAQVLSPSNMQSRFSVLLWLEELNAERELREFSIIGALLRKGAVYLHLEVPGLAEGRPNLYIGKVALSAFHHYCCFIVTVQQKKKVDKLPFQGTE